MGNVTDKCCVEQEKQPESKKASTVHTVDKQQPPALPGKID